DYIAQMKFKPPPRFADGFIVPDGGGHKHTLVGRLYPQPHVRTGDGRDVLLDDVLGNGFSILVRSPRPDAVLPLLAGRPWSDLGARVVVLGRDVIELGASSPRLARYTDHVILLRPDRYVAACIAVDDAARGGEKVAALIAKTF
ncbi:MAG: monooxygenase, partial [Pseudolabrys sp.]|nr:monooxygenase [Pseudolabrys sp.]